MPTTLTLDEIRAEYKRLNELHELARRQAWEGDTKRQRTAAAKRAGKLDMEKREVYSQFLKAGGSQFEALI